MKFLRGCVIKGGLKGMEAGLEVVGSILTRRAVSRDGG